MYEGRIRLTVRYDGTGFHGSQLQPGKRTVAGTLKAGLESLLKQETRLLFAGRTDAGVHADGNVCAFDACVPFPIPALAGMLNHTLPEDIRVREAHPAPALFHPRFDAVARTYEYAVYCSADVPVDRMRYTMAYDGMWDGPAVSLALAALAGEHAFHRFAEGVRDPRYAKCKLDPVVLQQQGPEVWIRIRGNRFLRQMVRRVIGAVIEVAGRRVSPEQFSLAVAGKMEFQFEPAPARGLTLVCVEYGI